MNLSVDFYLLLSFYRRVIVSFFDIVRYIHIVVISGGNAMVFILDAIESRKFG